MPSYYRKIVKGFEYCIEPLIYGDFYFAKYNPETADLICPKVKITRDLAMFMVEEIGFEEVEMKHD